MTWPFGDLVPLRYGLILVDAPWHFHNWSEKGEEKNPLAHYNCMDLDAIKALPVGQLAAKDAALFMWATWPMLPQALETMEAWGFQFKTGGAWHKKTKHGKTAFGTGYILRSASEPFLIGTIGKPHAKSKSERGLIEAMVREHSRKPDEAREMLERLFPNTWKVELFARERHENWAAWGNQVDKFDD